MNAILLTGSILLSRSSFRLLRALIVGRQVLHPNARPVFIYGAGDRGELLMRELLRDDSHRYAPIGFIDDDLTKVGKVIHGVPIFPGSELAALVERHRVKDILVSSPKVPEAKLKQVESLGVLSGKIANPNRTRRYPNVQDLLRRSFLADCEAMILSCGEGRPFGSSEQERAAPGFCGRETTEHTE
jgi:FlaA1/EpsC-like NDP-sugar epimerase